jgi:hypothetical protein
MDLVRLVKKHSALLLPIGLAFAAVLLFVPTILAGRAVKSQMQESVSLGSKVESLARTTPPATQYKEEQAYQQKHAEDANGITALTRQTSERQLLAYGMFPEPNETSSAIFMNFGKVYRKAIEDMVSGMRARDCPGEAEIAEVTRYGSTGGGYSSGTDAVSRNEAIIERFCKDRAESIPVYASPDIFSGYDFWYNYNYVGRDEAVEDCWKAQVAYWIQKDVVDTIISMDRDSNSVATSPVKRLLGISFSGSAAADASSRRGLLSGTSDAPRYVLSKTDGILTVPWTDRVSDADMDVVHFSVSLIVSNSAVERFMKELCSQKTHVFKGWSGKEQPQQFVHNQITILRNSVEPIVRPAAGTVDRYRYGEDGAVQLNLMCEYVFNKAGYAGIKPKLISEQAAASAGGPAAPRPTGLPRPPKKSGGGSTTKRGAVDEE